MTREQRPCHERIRRWFDAAVEVVQPRRAVIRALKDTPDLANTEGRLVVIGIGKAAHSMALGARDVFGDRIDDGILLTKYGHAGDAISGFQAYEAGHPVPDENGLAATRAILDAVDGLTDRDLVVALISGGGSALLELPRDDVSLEDTQAVTQRLMHAGAGIHDLNAVRKGLSLVKGGGLRRAIGPARCVSLLLSDVLGNDPTVIASGPTVIPTSVTGGALSVVERFGLSDDLPQSVRRTLETPIDQGADTVDSSSDDVLIIADNAAFVDEICRQADIDGLNVVRQPDPYEEDAAEFGREFVKLAMELDSDVDVLVRGGEATVAVTGDGIGGRNTEMALAAALALNESDWVIASLASDGDDGNSGAAGAIADRWTVAQALEEDIDPEEALRNNDSASVFKATGGLVVTGPSGTNVNDVYIALRCRTEKGN